MGNAWTEDPHMFEGHEYFTQLFDKPWLNIINPDFETKNFWRVMKEEDNKTIMLNSDIVMCFIPDTEGEHHQGVTGEVCAKFSVIDVVGETENERFGCRYVDPDDSVLVEVKMEKVATTALVELYKDNEEQFMNDFATAFDEMVMTGFTIDGSAKHASSQKGKLGNLKSVDVKDYQDYYSHSPVSIK